MRSNRQQPGSVYSLGAATSRGKIHTQGARNLASFHIDGGLRGVLGEPVRIGQESKMPIVRKLLCSSLFLLSLSSLPRSVAAQSVWQPSPGHTQMPLWPGAVPDARPAAGPEHVEAVTDPKDLVAGKPWLAIKDVSHPTLTVYRPKGRSTHATVIVSPVAVTRSWPSI